MTQGERVRMIRKHPNVNLTLEKFGEKLGIKKSALSLIENGKNNLTEQMAKSKIFAIPGVGSLLVTAIPSYASGSSSFVRS